MYSLGFSFKVLITPPEKGKIQIKNNQSMDITQLGNRLLFSLALYTKQEAFLLLAEAANTNSKSSRISLDEWGCVKKFFSSFLDLIIFD